MHLFKIVLAVLPALALAQDGPTTTTQTSTLTLYKTMTLSEVETIIATPSANSTTSSYTPTTTPSSTFTTPESSLTTTESSASGTTADDEPTALPTSTNEPGAGVALSASRVAFAGVAGVIIAALL